MTKTKNRTLQRVLLAFLLIGSAIGAEEGDAQDLEVRDEVTFLSPGVIAARQEGWIGSDHLYNLTADIGITIEILRTTEGELPFSADDLKKAVSSVFEKVNIYPETKGYRPLPYFHILIMIQPISNGYVVFLEGRLFEPVELERVVFRSGTTFQAITWERQNLIVSPKDKFKETVTDSVVDIAKQFADRFDFFETLRLREQTEK